MTTYTRELMIYYHKATRTQVLKDRETGETLDKFETYKEAKAAASQYQGALVMHAMRGGLRMVPWIEECECCGTKFPQPRLK